MRTFFIKIAVYLRNQSSPLEVIAHNVDLLTPYVDIIAWSEFSNKIEQGVFMDKIRISTYDILPYIDIRKGEKSLDVFFLLPEENSLILKPHYLGCFGLNGKFREAL